MPGRRPRARRGVNLALYALLSACLLWLAGVVVWSYVTSERVAAAPAPYYQPVPARAAH